MSILITTSRSVESWALIPIAKILGYKLKFSQPSDLQFGGVYYVLQKSLYLLTDSACNDDILSSAIGVQ